MWKQRDRTAHGSIGKTRYKASKLELEYKSAQLIIGPPVSSQPRAAPNPRASPPRHAACRSENTLSCVHGQVCLQAVDLIISLLKTPHTQPVIYIF